MNRVLFLDIDGVLLPGRAYMLPNQTEPIVKIFDPCAVSMVNSACEKQDRKIVLHSSWIRTGLWKIGEDGPHDVHNHVADQGINEKHFHTDLYCNRDIRWRYNRIDEWLSRHPEVDDFLILDDEPEERENRRYDNHLILTNFDEGITMEIYHRILDGTGKIIANEE